MATPSLVVKVGGSLFDLPDLAERLRRWLERQAVPDVLLVPGGGATADLVRSWDERHRLGEEKAHWLALRAMTLNAYLLADLLPGSRVVRSPDECGDSTERPAILDAFAFARRDEAAHPDDCLPHRWDATSDSVAARVAVVAGAPRLVLLKSSTIPGGIDWTDARLGFVDPLFCAVVRRASHGVKVEAINLRAWRS
jgi:aspartokinase-like uncharacterized kinase